MSTSEQNTAAAAFSVGAVARTTERQMTGTEPDHTGTYVTAIKGRDLYEALHGLDTLEFVIRKARQAIIDELRESGATWEGIGDALSISKQAAQQRFSRDANPR
jgi:hypothetical protein